MVAQSCRFLLRLRTESPDQTTDGHAYNDESLDAQKADPDSVEQSLLIAESEARHLLNEYGVRALQKEYCFEEIESVPVRTVSTTSVSEVDGWGQKT